MKKFLVITIALVSVCFFSCIVVNMADSAVKPEGEQENYKIFVGEYKSIKIDGICEVLYYAAPSDTVTLSVQPNLREYFNIEVINGELVVLSTRKINFGSKKPASLIVSAPSLEKLSIASFKESRGFEKANSFTSCDKIISDSFSVSISGTGSCELELDVINFNADLSGAGRIKLSGKADTAKLNLSGAGELNAIALQTGEASVNLAGTGSISVSCSENLQINANGVGSIEYAGTPRLSQNVNGVVSIKQIRN